jgi:hypothetical protein
VAPSITAASSSLWPSWVNTAPLPALKVGSSSSTVIAAVTAASAGRPAASSAWPFSSAARSASRAAFFGRRQVLALDAGAAVDDQQRRRSRCGLGEQRQGQQRGQRQAQFHRVRLQQDREWIAG